MNKLSKYIIIAILIAAVGAVLALKQNKTQSPAPQIEQTKPLAALPRLVDLGADKCIPCKMMAPILEELKTEYAAVLNVEFIDVWKNPDAGQKYDLRVIPTQIFYNASGKELFRHEGFFAKEDILAKWKEFGIELKKTK